MAIDEPDVQRLWLYPNGQPENAVASLRTLHLPEMPSAKEMKRETTLIIMDIHLASSKRKKLNNYCEGNGWWTDALITDHCGTAGVYVTNDHMRTIINLLHEAAKLMQPSKGRGKEPTTSEELTNRRVHMWLTLFDVKGNIR